MISSAVKYLRFILFISLTSCAVSITQPNEYQLVGVNQKSYATRTSSKTILIALPLAASGYQSNSLLYLTKDYTLSSFVKNEWDVPPAEMLQPLLTKSIQNTGYFYAIVSAPSSVQTTYRLETRLQVLQQNFTQHPSVVEMSIDATLVNNNTLKAVGSHHFSTRVPAASETPYGGVVAANKACQQLMEEISAWVVREAS